MYTTVQDTITELRRCVDEREAEARAEAIEAQWEAELHPIAAELLRRMGPGITATQVADIAQGTLDADYWADLAASVDQSPPTTAVQCLVVAGLRNHDARRPMGHAEASLAAQLREHQLRRNVHPAGADFVAAKLAECRRILGQATA